ncbi:unnamed protein product [Blepharisma stoltei]|uniref:Uncharacterized protein n=1 Tax=Blepharisma stoltei TaxID=1481888 RepID=A0AAU9ILY0_9CILI|nr:unnamed protein product [Blepharisma stoltei]
MLHKTPTENSINTTCSTPLGKPPSMFFERSPNKHHTTIPACSSTQNYFSPKNLTPRSSWEHHSEAKDHISAILPQDQMNFLSFKNEKLKIEVERDHFKQLSHNFEQKLSAATDEISQLKSELDYKDEMLKRLSKLVEEREQKFKDLFAKESQEYEEIMKEKEKTIKELRHEIEKYKKIEMKRKQAIKIENENLDIKINKIGKFSDNESKKDESILLEFSEDIDLFISNNPHKAKFDVKNHPEIVSIIEQIGDLKNIMTSVIKGEKISMELLIESDKIVEKRNLKKKSAGEALNDLCEIRTILSDICAEDCGSKCRVQ